MLKCIALAALLASSTTAMAAAEPYKLDPSHTTLAFLVDHIGYAKTLGYFSDVTGSFSYDADTGQASDITITVNTDSLQSDNKARDKHLRSKDFLNTGKHPQMTFSADAATIREGESAEIAGQLQLLGETRPLTLSVTLNKTGDYPFGHKRFTLGISARASLQRSDFGMDYGVANGLVGDTVDIIIETEANRQ